MTLSKVVNKKSSNDTLVYLRAEGNPCDFAETDYFCPPTSKAETLSQFYTYLRIIRIKYWDIILFLIGFAILFKHFRNKYFLLSFLQFSLTITVLNFGITHGVGYNLYKESVVTVICNVEPYYYPKYTVYEITPGSKGILIPKGSFTYWLFGFGYWFVTASIFASWLTWKKHRMKFDFGNIIFNTIAKIFSEFSVHIVIIIMSLYSLIHFAQLFVHSQDHHNVLLLVISLGLYCFYCLFLFQRYFYFDKLEIETIKGELKDSWEKIWHWLTHLL